MVFNRSLRGKIFVWLMLFVFIFLVACSVLALIASLSLKSINMRSSEINSLRIQLLTLRNSQNDFERIDLINQRYFATGKSPFLDQCKTLNAEISERICSLEHQDKPLINNDSTSIIVQHLCRCIEFNKLMFDSLTNLTYARGFKDWGFEGQMRLCAHKLEKCPEINTVDILQLRRREKDFIIRIDPSYIDSVKVMSQRIKLSISENWRISTKRKKELADIIDGYLFYFIQMSSIDLRVGVKNMNGFALQIHDNYLEIYNLIELLHHHSQEEQRSFYFYVTLVFAVVILLFVAFSLFFSYYLSTRITRPLSLLTAHIDSYTRSGFLDTCTLNLPRATTDVKLLTNNILKMQEEINLYINHFKRKVVERTREIELQKNIIHVQKTDLIDSINSAKLIQDSMLQGEDYISGIAPTSFVLYQPKDIVSGDFYFADWKWSEQSKSELFYMMVGDATGHGVPGAFMSLMGLSFIKLLFDKELSPSDFILALNNMLYKHLHKKSNSFNNFTAVDLALCCIDYKLRKLYFIGAHRPCYIARGGDIIELKRSVMGIGDNPAIENKIIANELDLMEGDNIFIFSDGYASQFDNQQKKKINSNRLKEYLLEASQHCPCLQKQILVDKLLKWQGSCEQTDDIVVMGLRINFQDLTNSN